MKEQASQHGKNLLRQARLRRGWSREYVAGLVGTNTMSLYRWESGRTFPTPHYRQRLAEVYGQSLEELGLIPVSEESDDHPIPPSPLLMPYDLPPYGLVGRDALLAMVREHLLADAAPRHLALTGLPGVGKTTLATAFVHDPTVQMAFPDGVLWAGLGPRPNVVHLLHAWLRKLDHQIEVRGDLDDLAILGRAIRERIGRRHLVLVIDDAWHIDDALALAVGGSECITLLTTRFTPLAHQFAQDVPFVVPELAQEDGLALLERLAPDLSPAYAAQSLAVVQAVGGLPLALVIVGQYLQRQAFHGQARRIQSAFTHLTQAAARLWLDQPVAPAATPPILPPGTPLSLQRVIAISIEALPPATSVLLRTLAVFPPKPNSFSEEAAEALWAGEPGSFAEHLDALCDANLVESVEPGRYTLHQTIAEYLQLTGVPAQAYERFVAYFAEYVRDHEDDYTRIEEDLPNLFRMLQVSLEREQWRHLIDGACHLTPFFLMGGQYDLCATYLEQALAAATALENVGDQCTLHNHLATVAQKRGHNAQAVEHASLALTLARQIDDSAQIAKALSLLGRVAYTCGESARAEALLLEGLQVAQTLADEPNMLNMLILLGALMQRSGEHVRAEQYLIQGLDLARATNQHEQAMGVLINLGINAGRRCDFAQAETYLQEALVIARTIKHSEKIGIILTNLAVAALEQGNVGQARDHLLEALDVLRGIGRAERLAGVLINLAEVASIQRNYAEAERYIAEGMLLAEAAGHQERLCSLLNIGGLVALKQEHMAVARHYLERGIHLAQTIGYPRKHAELLTHWGEYWLCQQQPEQATTAFCEAKEQAEAIENPDVAALALFGLARVAQYQGDQVQARQLGEEALNTLRAINHRQASEVEQWLITLGEDGALGGNAC